MSRTLTSHQFVDNQFTNFKVSKAQGKVVKVPDYFNNVAGQKRPPVNDTGSLSKKELQSLVTGIAVGVNSNIADTYRNRTESDAQLERDRRRYEGSYLARQYFLKSVAHNFEEEVVEKINALGLPRETRSAMIQRAMNRLIIRNGLSPADVAQIREMRVAPTAYRAAERRQAPFDMEDLLDIRAGRTEEQHDVYQAQQAPGSPDWFFDGVPLRQAQEQRLEPLLTPPRRRSARIAGQVPVDYARLHQGD